MSALLLILLLAGGMPLFDCFINVFGTAGTGGFSNHGASIGYYDSEYFEAVLGVFMILFGINFNLYYLIFLKRIRAAFRSEELHWYLGIILASTLAIAAGITKIYGSFGTALRHAFFNTATLIVPDGAMEAYMATDAWPLFKYRMESVGY